MLTEREINKYPWEPPYGGMLACEEENIDLEQTKLKDAQFFGCKLSSKPHAIRMRVDKPGLTFLFLSHTPDATIDLQQVFSQGSWEYDEQEHTLSRLEDAAEAHDRGAFLEALQDIEWRDRPPMDFTRAIQLAFRVGAHLAARQISAEGARHHAEDAEIQKYARVLAPPRVISKSVPSDPARKANREWLTAHSGEYKGQWVAIRNGELFGAANSLKELVESIGSTKGILLARAQ